MLQPTAFPDHETLSRHAADWLVERMTAQPCGLTCLASGGTPTRTYELTAERLQKRAANATPWRLLKLDEWGGMAADDPGSCDFHLRQTLVDPLGPFCTFEGFEGTASDPGAECQRIHAWLQTHGPIETCVLGLGINGHLGFNEPAESMQPHAHVAPLSAASLSHAMLGERASRPRYGLTLGMADLLQAKEILLVVSGESKREPLRRLLQPEISPAFPASFLWLHPRVQLLCDASCYE
jgi:galactosamine-6-phosphate isomerase